MNRNAVPVLLATALLAGVTATAGLCYWYLQSVRQNRQAQEEVARINRNKSFVQAMAAETVEYSRRNPALLPVLQKVGITRRAETNATSAGAR